MHMAAQAHTQVDEAVRAWPDVEAHPHRFGGTEYRLGRREIGHIHGDYLVDIPFPTKVRDEVVQSGQAEPHHVLPDSGWVSIFLRQPADVERAIGLLRRSYDLAVAQKQRQSQNAALQTPEVSEASGV
jgi:predicted DNA-binding protein (MmcQ/YjbR family)